MMAFEEYIFIGVYIESLKASKMIVSFLLNFHLILISFHLVFFL